MVRRIALLIAGALAASGCNPAIDQSLSIIDGPRVLAIQSTPAEAEPGDLVTFVALHVDANGTRAEGELDWAYCVDRKPLTELGPVSPSCLRPSGTGLVPIGTGLSATGALPDDGCRQFGPNRPEPKAGEPAGRAIDPDPTGGYYQPVRLFVADEAQYVTGATRLACGLGDATQEQSADYGAHAHPNENPVVASIELVTTGGTTVVPPGDPGAPPGVKVAPGEEVTLRVRWPDCSGPGSCGDGICTTVEDKASCPDDCSDPVGCGGAERYLWFDPGTRALETRRESMRVSWFATSGAFDTDRTGREEADTAASSDNGWKAPSTAARVELWAVVRDDRGGVGWRGFAIDVQP